MTTTHVYTDGACIGKEPHRHAGYGVYWGHEDARNVSAPLAANTLQTNQRAELRAIVHALEQIGGDAASSDAVTIFTDSRYSIDCITKWRLSWQLKGWTTASKEPVKNRDLIEHAGALYDALSHRVSLAWIKGHSTSLGNNSADQLASRAAAAAARAAGH